MEPPSKGHFGTSHFVPCSSVVVHISEVEMYCIYTLGNIGSVLCREVVPFSEGPLLEVPLYSETWSLSIMDTIGTGQRVLITHFRGSLYTKANSIHVHVSGFYPVQTFKLPPNVACCDCSKSCLWLSEIQNVLGRTPRPPPLVGLPVPPNKYS